MTNRQLLLLTMMLPLVTACGVKGSLKRPEPEQPQQQSEQPVEQQASPAEPQPALEDALGADFMPHADESGPGMSNRAIDPEEQLEQLRQYRP